MKLCHQYGIDVLVIESPIISNQIYEFVFLAAGTIMLFLFISIGKIMKEQSKE